MQKKNHQQVQNRYLEIDLIKGLAVIGMIIYHLLYNILFLVQQNFLERQDFVNYNKIIYGTFFICVGINLKIYYKNLYLRTGNNSFIFIFSKLWKKFLRLFVVALGISLFTYLAMPSYYIFFGTIHFIAFSLLLSIFFLKFNPLTNFLLAAFVLGLGLWFIQNNPFLELGTNIFVFLGIKGKVVRSFDYSPIFPYYFLVLIGLSLSDIFYKDVTKPSKISLLFKEENKIVKFLTYLGKKSLVIYVLHQPILTIIIISLGLLGLFNLKFDLLTSIKSLFS